MVQCRQQLFTPTKYPVSSHPLWDPLISLLRCYGFRLTSHGWWDVNLKESAAAINNEHLLESIVLATKHVSIPRTFGPEEDLDIVTLAQRISAARLTVHLREMVLYLQLQSDGVDLPAIEEASLETPFMRLKKHQEDALFEEFEKGNYFNGCLYLNDFLSQDGGHPHRKIWEFERRAGWVPNMDWKNGRYC